MASAGCLKCLPRPGVSQFRTATSSCLVRAPFSTSSHAAAQATGDMLKRQQAKSAHLKGKGSGAKATLRIKKKPFVKTGKPPMPGERKAARKRIVLSNTNALEVVGMRDYTREMVGKYTLEERSGGQRVAAGAEGKAGGLETIGATATPVVGRVLGLAGETVDCLRAAEAFKTTQNWGLFRRPSILVRSESVKLARWMVKAEEAKTTLRVVIDGERGTGKSLMLVHALASASVRDWVIFNIPEAQELTTAVTPYAPIPNTTPTLYSQNDYTAAWLTRISKSNSAILLSLKLSQQHHLPIPIQSNITLFRLCELGARDPDIAWPVFQALWTELTSEGRPPILFTLDSLQFAMNDTLYKSTDFHPIHAHDLAILKHFADYLSDSKTLPNGGAVIAATQRSHAPINLTMDLAIQQTLDKQNKQLITPKDSYEKQYDPRSEAALSKMRVLRIGGLDKVEARGLMEYWAQSGVLRSVVDERTVAEKWALAGHGVVAEIEKGTLKMRI